MGNMKTSTLKNSKLISVFPLQKKCSTLLRAGYSSTFCI